MKKREKNEVDIEFSLTFCKKNMILYAKPKIRPMRIQEEVLMRGSGRCYKMNIVVINMYRIAKRQYISARSLWDLKETIVIVDAVLEKKICEQFSWFILASCKIERIWLTWGLTLLQIVILGEVKKEFTGSCPMYGSAVITRGHICVRKDIISNHSQQNNSNCLIPNLSMPSLKTYKIKRVNNIHDFLF